MGIHHYCGTRLIAYKNMHAYASTLRIDMKLQEVLNSPYCESFPLDTL